MINSLFFSYFNFSLPKNQEDMDKRSESTRLFFPNLLAKYGGQSYKEQSSYTNQVVAVWTSLTQPTQTRRQNFQETMALETRYLIALGVTLSPLLWSRHHRPRRMAFLWLLSTWFACPEWSRAYWRP